MRGKWPDFLFTLAVRFVSGAVLGTIAALLICAPLSRRGSLLLWVFGDETNPLKPYFWFGAWSLVGAIIAVLTTPKWQTPWYKRDREALNVWTDWESPGEDRIKPGRNTHTFETSVSIKTVGQDGETREFSSMEEVPPEIRAELEALERDATQQKGDELSITKTSQTGDEITSKIIRRKSRSVYKIVDESGVERTYRSLEEMPPEIRAAIADAEKKMK